MSADTLRTVGSTAGGALTHPLPRLADRFDLEKPVQLLNGMQAIVRLVLMQKWRDRAAGLSTAGYVTGYRGSPIATLETAFRHAGRRVPANDIVFHPAINEELAATALWGTQQAELRGEGRFDGVFGVWYGKGPGVDRSGDAFRHANHAGTSPNGGVIALMGDDHTCESSTSAHQSEFAFVDAMIPILNPAGIQDLLDYGIHGFAMSRFAGVWVGIKCVKDNVESSAVVDARPDRVTLRLPTSAEYAMPEGGLSIRLGDPPLAKEERLHRHKRGAVLAYARANGLDRIVFPGGDAPRIGIIAAGKSYNDVRHALHLIGIDEREAEQLGVRLYKPALVWPLEPQGLAAFSQGLDLVIVVEEKRSLIETQVKEQLYDRPDRPRVVGKRDEDGAMLFPASGALDPLDIAIALGRRIGAESGSERVLRRTRELEGAAERRKLAPEAMQRRAYFCAGCPHNTSTRVPDGARAYAGIGCHYMVQWMDRDTEGFTQMGAEGANWIGEAPFSRRRHVYQNIGDGTYVHSGSLAMRAAIASGVTMTYKLLYNDAVAMTGGQHLDGNMSVTQMAAQLVAEGARRVVIVTDAPERYHRGNRPDGVSVHAREDLDTVQRDLAQEDGVTVLLYDQTCAAEKRRRRKAGTIDDPQRRLFINPRVCEGCGDCGAVSNCVAITPLETPFGRKRRIDQSLCNKDYSCLGGLCPSFVSVIGGTPRAPERRSLDAMTAHLAEPERHGMERPIAVVATGIGGTGVVTVTAVLGQAAHIAGLGFGAIDVTGIAQKGGPVVCHMRFARQPADIHAIRVGVEDADVVLGGDLVVTASNKVLEMVRPGATALVVSPHAATSGEFTHAPGLATPTGDLKHAIAARTGMAAPTYVAAHEIAVRLLGDSIYANMILVGAAFQMGLLPLDAQPIEDAIAVNGVDVEANREAFRLGRLAVAEPERIASLLGQVTGATAAAPSSLDELVGLLADDLARYQDEHLAQRYRTLVARVRDREATVRAGSTTLSEAVARTYHKVLAIKDEYEVSRLMTDGRLAHEIASAFSGVKRIELHLAPPLFARTDPETGRPEKWRFGPWVLPVLRLLARGRRLRGGALDPFSYTKERRAERALVTAYERDVDLILARLDTANFETAVALARLPLGVRGYGVVKQQAMEKAEREREALRAALVAPAPAKAAAE